MRFHDGSPFDAAAAKAALDRTRKLGLGAAYIWSAVTDIEAPAPDTLVIETAYPAPIDLIASSQYGAYIYSEAAARAGAEWFLAGHADGTGPYRVAGWQPGQQVVLERNDDYWGGWGGETASGAFDRVLLRAVQSPTTQLQMLRGGEADVISIAPVDMLVRALEEPGIEATFAPSWVNVIVQLNTRSYPTDNVLFRRALTHAWDYDAINRYIYYGRSRRAHGIIPDGMWGYDPDLAMPAFDLERGAPAARSLRRAARRLAPHAHLQQRLRGVQEHRQGLPAQPGEDRRAPHAAPGSVGDDLERGQEPAHGAAGVPHGVVADLSVAGGLADGTLQHREVAAVQPLALQQPRVRSTGGRGGGARGGRARPGDREVPARAGDPGRAGGGDLRRRLRRSRHPSQRSRGREAQPGVPDGDVLWVAAWTGSVSITPAALESRWAR